MKTRPKTRSRGFSARKTKFLGVFCKNQGPIHKNWKDPRADVQKDLGWTVGSILEKLRDLNVKNKSCLEILLNATGRRVVFKERR